MSKKRKLSSLEVLCMVRDARQVFKVQKAVLYELILRSSAKSGWGCWPSYETICEDAGYKQSAVLTAVRELEAANLITRQSRPHQSNRYYINVALIQQQAEEARATREVVYPHPYDPSFSDRVEADADLHNTDVLDLNDEEDLPISSEPTFQFLQKNVLRVFADNLHVQSSHFYHRYFTSSLRACVDLAGSVLRCGQVIDIIISTKPKTVESLMQARNLPAYLRSSFPGWLKACESELTPLSAVSEPGYSENELDY
jgi:DNA-binding MarR family transcriptional regulator